ncbi:hypothetical protein QYU88_001358 [Salmonella enterica]|nr:hypothetical protein [Salmonella enterica]
MVFGQFWPHADAPPACPTRQNTGMIPAFRRVPECLIITSAVCERYAERMAMLLLIVTMLQREQRLTIGITFPSGGQFSHVFSSVFACTPALVLMPS